MGYLMLLLDFLNIGLIGVSSRQVTPEEIDRNIRKLKKERWFQSLLSNERYRHLVTSNINVREKIGQLKIEKMNVHSSRIQHRVERILTIQ